MQNSASSFMSSHPRLNNNKTIRNTHYKIRVASGIRKEKDNTGTLTLPDIKIYWDVLAIEKVLE